MVVSFGKVTITEVACALILGIVTNIICNIGKNKEEVKPAKVEAESAESVEATEEKEDIVEF